MKVVKNKDEKIVYGQDPDFESGKGILNAIVNCGGTLEDYVEVEVERQEWIVYVESLPRPPDPLAEIKTEIQDLKMRIGTLEKKPK
jgi:predicted DNA-binding transcriptional regulator